MLERCPLQNHVGAMGSSGSFLLPKKTAKTNRLGATIAVYDSREYRIARDSHPVQIEFEFAVELDTRRSLSWLRKTLIKISAKFVWHATLVTFRMAAAAVLRALFAPSLYESIGSVRCHRWRATDDSDTPRHNREVDEARWLGLCKNAEVTPLREPTGSDSRDQPLRRIPSRVRRV